jgi:hypothetical protein
MVVRKSVGRESEVVAAVASWDEMEEGEGIEIACGYEF